MILDLTSFFSPTSLRTLLQTSDFEPVTMYQTPSPLWYPESFRRKFPRLGSFLGTTPLSMLLFAPLIVIDHLIGKSDNLTVLAWPKRNVQNQPVY